MQNFDTQNVYGTVFEIKPRYTQLKPVGMGAFGLVCSSKDSVTKQDVAIKKILKPFSNAVLAKRTYRELRLLTVLRHKNIITMSDVFISPSNDIYFVAELLGTDLQRLLATRKLESQYMQYFLYQILKGLKYLHSAGVVHRDLKPSNVLVNENCDIKICDFGLARLQDNQMTGYVSTRYYRAPEIMLTWQQYDFGIDMWSAGCILGEMLEGKPIFPGKDHVSQFKIITELLGTPDDEVLKSVASENTLKFVRSLPRKEKVPFNRRFNGQDVSAVALLEKLLVFDPKKRLTAEQALADPFLKTYHDPKNEPKSATVFDWSFNAKDIPPENWQELIEREVSMFNSRTL